MTLTFDGFTNFKTKSKKSHLATLSSLSNLVQIKIPNGFYQVIKPKQPISSQLKGLDYPNSDMQAMS